MSEFTGNKETTANIQIELDEVKQKVVNYLSTINLSLDDLKPQYSCSICKDTGFDGIKKCTCYEKVVKSLMK